jgi:hypothetical protein
MNKYKNSDGQWDLSNHKVKAFLFTGVVAAIVPVGLMVACSVNPGSYCGDTEQPFTAGETIGLILCLWPCVYWVVHHNLMRSDKKAREEAADRVRSQEKAKEAASGWQPVIKVVCPHCQETGGVQHFTPYEAPRDLLKEGVMWHLTDKTIGHVEVAPAEKIGRDIREASQVAQTPNMRCTNCTIEWRV